MENVITFIVIAIMIVSAVSKIKAKQKKKKSDKPSGSGGWIEKLNTFLANIEKNVQQQSKGSTTGISAWKQLMEGAKAGRLQTDPHEDSLEDLILEEDELPVLTKQKRTVRPVKAPIKRPDKEKISPDATRKPALQAQKSKRSGIAMDRASLRRAVIWSEILGPPVALRDQQGDRR